MEKFHLYINYNEDPRGPLLPPINLPKAWMVSDSGKLLYGTINKNFRGDQKARGYHTEHRNKKISEGYVYFGMFDEDFLTKITSTRPAWSILLSYWFSKPHDNPALSHDVVAFENNKELQDLALKIVANDPGKVITSNLSNNISKVKSTANQSSLNSPKPAERAKSKALPKFKKITNEKSDDNTDASWSW